MADDLTRPADPPEDSDSRALLDCGTLNREKNLLNAWFIGACMVSCLVGSQRDGREGGGPGRGPGALPRLPPPAGPAANAGPLAGQTRCVRRRPADPPAGLRTARTAPRPERGPGG